MLVVIAIISILAVFLFVSFTQVQKSSRDAQRKSDLQTVAGALQRFYSDNSHYPSDLSGEIAYESDCSSGTTVSPAWGTSGITCGSKNYIKQLPTDPIGTREYCYVAVDVDPTAAGINIQNYNLYARLEGTTGTLSCGVESDYNYQVTAQD